MLDDPDHEMICTEILQCGKKEAIEEGIIVETMYNLNVNEYTSGLFGEHEKPDKAKAKHRAVARGFRRFA